MNAGNTFEFCVAWNPGTDQIALVYKSMRSQIETKYRYVWEIRDSVMDKLSSDEVRKLVLAQALSLIVIYHCDPSAVHQVFLQLAEYVEGWIDLLTHSLL